MTEVPLEKVSVIPPDAPSNGTEKINTPTVTPLDMLNRAVESGADIAMIEKLMALHERWDANQARKAFDEAVAAAKRDIPPITRNVTGHNAKKYADFAAIAKVVDPIIGAHGLSYRFRTTQTDRISVTCILSHKAGHAEETTLSGPADTSGNKNAIQAIGSTLTYLQRYSLVQMLGLAAGNDDDGNAAGDGEPITSEQLADIVELADEVGADKIAFCKYFSIASLADIKAKDFARAVAALNRKRAK
jgi:ERF superfamily